MAVDVLSVQRHGAWSDLEPHRLPSAPRDALRQLHLRRHAVHLPAAIVKAGHLVVLDLGLVGLAGRGTRPGIHRREPQTTVREELAREGAGPRDPHALAQLDRTLDAEEVGRAARA